MKRNFTILRKNHFSRQKATKSPQAPWKCFADFSFLSVLGVKMLNLMKFHYFSFCGLKNAKYAFLRFGAKIHPINHYVYKVLSNFPAGMIFYHDFHLLAFLPVAPFWPKKPENPKSNFAGWGTKFKNWHKRRVNTSCPMTTTLEIAWKTKLFEKVPPLIGGGPIWPKSTF